MKKLLFILCLIGFITYGCEKEDSISCYECTITKEKIVPTEFGSMIYECYFIETVCDVTKSEIDTYKKERTSYSELYEDGITKEIKVSCNCEKK